jgi:hypothetical protein
LHVVVGHSVVVGLQVVVGHSVVVGGHVVGHSVVCPPALAMAAKDNATMRALTKRCLFIGPWNLVVFLNCGESFVKALA